MCGLARRRRLLSQESRSSTSARARSLGVLLYDSRCSTVRESVKLSDIATAAAGPTGPTRCCSPMGLCGRPAVKARSVRSTPGPRTSTRRADAGSPRSWARAPRSPRSAGLRCSPSRSARQLGWRGVLWPSRSVDGDRRRAGPDADRRQADDRVLLDRARRVLLVGASR